jgi:hypothetical protein
MKQDLLKYILTGSARRAIFKADEAGTAGLFEGTEWHELQES